MVTMMMVIKNYIARIITTGTACPVLFTHFVV